MFERLRIKYLGQQPAAKVSSETLDKIIQRDYGENFEHGRNRFSAAVLKLSNGDLTKVDEYWIFRSIVRHHSAAKVASDSDAKFSTVPLQRWPLIPLESTPVDY